MKIKVGELRRLVREASPAPLARARKVVSDTVEAAEHYVHSVEVGKPDGHIVTTLRSQADEAASYAKWLINRREDGADVVGMVAKYALDMSELAQFWKRPAFFGKREYLEQLEDLLAQMQKYSGGIH